MKKLFTCMVALFLATTALWADGWKSGDLYFRITSDSTAEVTYSNYYHSGEYSNLTSIVIPSTYTYWSIYSGSTTYKVTCIGERAFHDCTNLISVTIPESVTEIRDGAFSGCTGLTSITIPSSVTYLSGFSGCTGLTSITIPNSVTSIGSSAFSGCTGLTSITIPNSVTSIGSSAFSGCTGLTSITIPNSVTSIGDYAFYGCTGLTSITIPNSVTSIGYCAFYGCTGLTSITIPNSVTSIEGSAFSGCTGLTSVVWNAKKCEGWSRNTYSPFYDIKDSITSFTFGGEVDSIPNYLCSGMNRLTSITIPKSVTSIEKDVFADCTGFTSIAWNAKQGSYSGYSSPFSASASNIVSFTLGDSVENIPTYLCYDMSNLTSITIPNSVTSIGSCAFKGCTGLTSITIPNSVTSIGSGAFSGCTGLTSITIPNSVTSIGSGAFEGCTGLTSVVWNAKKCEGWSRNIDSPFYYIKNNNITSVIFGEEIETIPAYLCYGMSKLTSVTIPNSVTSIGSGAFADCTGLTSVVWNARKCQGWTEITNPPFYSEASKITSFTFGDEVENIPNYLCFGLNKLTSIAIPNTITSIGEGSFMGCSRINNITIPDNVTDIGSSAFSGCTSLASITIPKGITSIKVSTFYECFGLKQVSLPNSIKSIGAGAFGDCSSLTTITIPDSVTSIGSSAFSGCTSLTTITIPKGVTSIESGTFSGCNSLKQIALPDSITRIGGNAFNSCTGLTSITIPNSVTSIGGSAFSGCKSLTVVTVPDSVKSIGAGAFTNCTGLQYVFILPHTPPTCPSSGSYGAFDSSTPIMVYEKDVTTYLNHSNWKTYNIVTYGLGLFSDFSPTQSTIKCRFTTYGKNTTGKNGMQYSKHGEFYYWDVQEIPLNSGTDSIAQTDVTITDLNPNTKYYLRSYMEMPNGTKIYGKNVKVGTKPINSISVSNLQKTQTTLELRLQYDAGDAKNRNTNGIEYCVGTSFGKQTKDRITIYFNGQDSVATLDTIVTGLTPNTTYCYRGFFDTQNGGRIYSEEKNATTLKVIVSAPTLTQYGQTYMLLSTSCNYGDATLVEEAVEYGTSKYGDDLQKASVSNNMVKINNLFPDTRYYYRSLLTTAEGGTIYSDWQEMTTKAITLSTGEADGISAKSVFLHGTIDCDMESRTEIGFEWKRSDAPSTVKPQRVLVTDRADSTLVFRLEGLSKDKYYDYRAFCLYKEQTYYGKADDGREWVTFLTAEDDVLVAPSVQTLDAEVSENGVELKGFVVAGTENIIQKGFESWRKGTTDVATTVSEGAIMTNEIPEPWSYTTYQYRAYAKTPSGTTYGETREVTTGYIHKEITDVVVTPSATTATVTWTIVEQADYYILTLFGNAEMTDTLATYTVDEAGNITQRRAPAALRALVNCSIDQLTPDTDYFFTVIAYNSDEKKVAEENGSFTTQLTTDIDNISDNEGDSDIDTDTDSTNHNANLVRKVFRNGQVYILRGDKTYTLTGVEVE